VPDLTEFKISPLDRVLNLPAIDLAGTWERANLDTKLDLQGSLFGSTLYFEPGTADPFLNQKNTLLFERLWTYFAECEEDEYIPESWVRESEFENEEIREVGVGDGI
jgi:hypothetical protein